MTFQEAKTAKKNLGYSEIADAGVEFRVFIAPQLPKDFESYIKTIPRYLIDLTDDHAAFYSSNQKFRLIGLDIMWGNSAAYFFKQIEINSNI